MGQIFSLFCQEPSVDWIDVNKSGDKNVLNEWMGTIPEDNFKGVSKIFDKKYEQLMLKLLNKENSVFTHKAINEIIGDTIKNRPRLVRVGKSENISEHSLYEKLQFLSISYPKIMKLETGTSKGFHGFINLSKYKRIVFLNETNNTLDPFNNEIKHPTESKIKVFHHTNKSSQYIKHDLEKRISWDIGGITNVKVNNIIEWVNIKEVKITKNNIEEKSKELLQYLNLSSDINMWGLHKFIQSIIESYKTIPANGIGFFWKIYESPDICHMIRNGNIPDLIEDMEDKQIYLDAVNSISFFKDDPLTLIEIFGNDTGNGKLVEYYTTTKDISAFDSNKVIKLIVFYNEYSVIGNREWCNSNVNIKNINYEYLIPEKSSYME